MVQDVKELGPELNIDISRTYFDGVVLEYRDIQIQQARPDHGVASGIAKQVHAGSRDRVAIPIKSRLAHAGE